MGRPLRILFPYVGDTVGGSHVSSLTLAKALDPMRHEVVVGVHEHGLLADYLAREGIEPQPLPRVRPPKLRPRWRQPLRIRAAAAALMPTLRALKIDVVHTHDQRMHLAWGVAARAARVPHIWHQRTPSPGRDLPVFTRDAAHLIAVSRFVRESFAPAARAEAEVVYNPFTAPPEHDAAASRSLIRTEMGATGDGPIVGFVSNLTDRKRPLLFVEIAERMAGAGLHAGAVFPMFGEARPPLADAVAARIAAGPLGDRVQIMGPRFPFAPYLAGLDLLIAPARHEALGRTLIEAAFAGVPVVATDEGGTPEIFDHGRSALLAPPDDAGAFAEAGVRLLSEPDRTAAMTAAARADAESRFSLATHLARMEEIYDGLRR
ncbi:glycosyltransferase family 4 protein [Roseivivax marinus]|uniref:glycosyltransferase family 4 protein n=1 Tax=Roseivivax marinus TaxID=1379903 RepID=UPI001F049E19|nr:glycosyltransferase family 4 protein [Roseivivax marinus]UMA66062.1 glycosyltransferase family 4 protein [Roseivivax marinus]